eukprot:GDKJ01017207.1.p1 GENE.GDKJ01017207.1~~GDKJ01017207.1.p1  ORF type:complete len:862 (+),score=263.02 GDKJ01017207.1:390-2588(+)
MKNAWRKFRIGRQEDSHEAMKYLLEALTKSSVPVSARKTFDSLPEPKQASTIINQIFGGFIRQSIKCSKCNNRSNRYELFQDVAIDLASPEMMNSLKMNKNKHQQQNPTINLESCLERIVKKEHLNKSNQYHCDLCKTKVDATLQRTIHEPPKILTLLVKRFSYYGSKNSAPISYPEILDLSPYVTRKNAAGISVSPALGPAAAPLFYKLSAVIVHVGSTPCSGHYRCFAKTGGKDSSAPGASTWALFDDSSVAKCSVEEALKVKGGAYVLMYEACDFKPRLTLEELRKLSGSKDLQSAIPPSVESKKSKGEEKKEEQKEKQKAKKPVESSSQDDDEDEDDEEDDSEFDSDDEFDSEFDEDEDEDEELTRGRLREDGLIEEDLNIQFLFFNSPEEAVAFKFVDQMNEEERKLYFHNKKEAYKQLKRDHPEDFSSDSEDDNSSQYAETEDLDDSPVFWDEVVPTFNGGALRIRNRTHPEMDIYEALCHLEDEGTIMFLKQRDEDGEEVEGDMPIIVPCVVDNKNDVSSDEEDEDEEDEEEDDDDDDDEYPLPPFHHLQKQKALHYSCNSQPPPFSPLPLLEHHPRNPLEDIRWTTHTRDAPPNLNPMFSPPIQNAYHIQEESDNVAEDFDNEENFDDIEDETTFDVLPIATNAPLALRSSLHPPVPPYSHPAAVASPPFASPPFGEADHADEEEARTRAFDQSSQVTEAPSPPPSTAPRRVLFERWLGLLNGD